VSQLRLNPLTGRWVTIATERASRPSDFVPRRLPVEAEPDRPCPFCPGNEEATLPALETYGPHGKWLVRVVPNLWPAFEGDGDMVVKHLGPVWRQAPGNGIHEVLVFTPEHKASWADLDDKQAGLVIAAIRDRMEDHARLSSVAYTQAIVNHGREAGASLEHPHGQLLAIPFVPGELSDELKCFKAFTAGDCLLCTAAEEELGDRYRVLIDHPKVLVLCPFWSGSPYELLVIPRAHTAHLDRADPATLVAVSRALRDALGQLRRLLGDVAYNVMFHTAPHTSDDDTRFHWHVHVVPHVTTTAGFEQGTGVRINIVAPETAAHQLVEA